MKLAKPSDKVRVIHILTAAFADNKSVNYIVEGDNRTDRIRYLMDYAFEMCYRFGRVYLSNDDKACALVIFPEEKRVSLRSILLDVSLVFKTIGLVNIKKALSRERKIKAIQPKDRMAYVWFIGVDPDGQRAGIGTKLMKELIDEMTHEDRPIYLETSTIENLP